MAGSGSHGRSTVAGVVPPSSLSYNFLSRETTVASSAISEQDKLRTVVWKTSCKGVVAISPTCREREKEHRAPVPHKHRQMGQTCPMFPSLSFFSCNPQGLEELLRERVRCPNRTGEDKKEMEGGRTVIQWRVLLHGG